MADFIQPLAKVLGSEVGQLFTAGQEAEFAFGAGTCVFARMPVAIYGVTTSRWVTDDTGVWWEVGFTMDSTLTGNASTGWVDAGNYFKLEIQQSLDLINWSMGKFTPVATTDNGDTTFTYWGRCTVPRLWKYVKIDLTAISARYGKTITAVKLFGATLALPGYPYAMPTQAAALQADLRALGYTGATVTSIAAPLTAEIIRYYYTNGGAVNDLYQVTYTGASVSLVKTGAGASISLPGYPYAIPSQAATLQADLITAGHTGAVVRLFADTWTIFIPDRDTVLAAREFQITFTPADPRPEFDMFGGQTTNQDNLVSGISSNLRATASGATLSEAEKQFARFKITSGTRYL